MKIIWGTPGTLLYRLVYYQNLDSHFILIKFISKRFSAYTYLKKEIRHVCDDCLVLLRRINK